MIELLLVIWYKYQGEGEYCHRIISGDAVQMGSRRIIKI